MFSQEFQEFEYIDEEKNGSRLLFLSQNEQRHSVSTITFALIGIKFIFKRD